MERLVGKAVSLGDCGQDRRGRGVPEAPPLGCTGAETRGGKPHGGRARSNDTLNINIAAEMLEVPPKTDYLMFP